MTPPWRTFSFGHCNCSSSPDVTPSHDILNSHLLQLFDIIISSSIFPINHFLSQQLHHHILALALSLLAPFFGPSIALHAALRHLV